MWKTFTAALLAGSLLAAPSFADTPKNKSNAKSAPKSDTKLPGNAKVKQTSKDSGGGKAKTTGYVPCSKVNGPNCTPK